MKFPFAMSVSWRPFHWPREPPIRDVRYAGRRPSAPALPAREASMTPLKRALALPAALLAAGGILAISLPAASSQAATTTLCNSQTAPLDGSGYTIENNEWGSSAPEGITTDGSTDFPRANPSIDNPTNGAPGGYTAIYKGCHWGACT